MKRRSFFHWLAATVAALFASFRNSAWVLPPAAQRPSSRLPAPGPWRHLRIPEPISAERLYESCLPHFVSSDPLIPQPRARVTAFLAEYDPGEVTIRTVFLNPARMPKATLTAVSDVDDPSTELPEDFSWA